MENYSLYESTGRMKLFKKILIANRGEIAVRIIRSARKMGIRTVAIYSEADEGALHAAMADEAVLIGGVELHDSYLNVEKIIKAAKETACDALHPGYGFLAESPLLVEACEKAGIVFIGPNTRAIQLMGNKIEARAFVKKLNVPMTEGVTGTPAELVKKSASLEYPILIKAAAGGGGKGMRILYDGAQLKETLEATSREAKNYFGDGSIYIEKYIEEPRHIEIQIMGDNHGNVVHLFERECSIQRRYQKIIEESPSPTLTPAVRKKMGEAAASIAKAVEYNSAGTVEFLVDKNLNFYFLEMNTRIQVEHPVTEMVTGVDLVEEQIRVAAGETLRLKQKDLKQNGHAVECRIYAEDPAQQFMPAPGKMSFYQEPAGANVRVDSATDKAIVVQSNFDPMISKLVVWGKDRDDAIKNSIAALRNYVVQGITTNIPYLLYLLQQEAFKKNQISTKYCDTHTEQILEEIDAFKTKEGKDQALVALALYVLHQHQLQPKNNIWNAIGYWRMVNRMTFMCNTEEISVLLKSQLDGVFELVFQDRSFETSLVNISQNEIEFRIFNDIYKAYLSVNDKKHYFVTVQGVTFTLERPDTLLADEDHFSDDDASGDGNLFAPMPGKVIKINVKEGEEVKRGTLLLVVEAMKMENNIVATHDALVEKVNVKEGDRVDTDLQLVSLKTIETN